MRNQRPVALAHSGVKLNGPAEAYGRKKELQVRQWLTSLPPTATEASLLPDELVSTPSDFEDLPTVVQDLYRQLTDSTEGFSLPVIDDPPTYPNSNIPRGPASPRAAPSTPHAKPLQSKVPTAPDVSRGEAPPQSALAAVAQHFSNSQLNKVLDSSSAGQSGRFDGLTVASSIPFSPISTVGIHVSASQDVVQGSGSTPATTADSAGQLQGAVPSAAERKQAASETEGAELHCPSAALRTIRQAADALVKEAEREAESREDTLHRALLQSLANFEKFKHEVRQELQETRQAAAKSRSETSAAETALQCQLAAVTNRAEQAEQSLRALQAVALQEKQKAQALKAELEEHADAKAQLTTQLEDTTASLQRTAAAHVVTVKQLEAQLNASKQETQKAREQAVAAQHKQQLHCQKLEAEVASLESQLRACNAKLTHLTQEQEGDRQCLAAETEARAAAEASARAATARMQEQSQLAAEMQQLLESSWLLQQQHNVRAARMAALVPASTTATVHRLDSTGRREAAAQDGEQGPAHAGRNPAANASGSRPSNKDCPGSASLRPTTAPSTPSTPTASAGRSHNLRRRDSSQGGDSSTGADTPGVATSSGDGQRLSSGQLRQAGLRGGGQAVDATADSSTGQGLAHEPGRRGTREIRPAKNGAAGSPQPRGSGADRRVVLEAQKAERRAAASAAMEESRLMEAALEAAPQHLRSMDAAFRTCILSPDPAYALVARQLVEALSPGYRTFLDPDPPMPGPSSQHSSNPAWAPSPSPVLDLCLTTTWFATPIISPSVLQQLARVYSTGRLLILIAPSQMPQPPQLPSSQQDSIHSGGACARDDSGSGSGTALLDPASLEGLTNFMQQAWESRIMLPWPTPVAASGSPSDSAGSPAADAGLPADALQQVARHMALRLGVCDDALRLLPQAALKRAKKLARPNLLHLNLPSLNQLHLDGSTMPELATDNTALDPGSAPPQLSLGGSVAMDLCHALQHNTTIKLLTLSNLPMPTVRAFAMAVTAPGCAVLTLHSHNDIPVGALLGRAPPCTQLNLTRQLSPEDAAVLSTLLPHLTTAPPSLSLHPDTTLPAAAAAELCTAIAAMQPPLTINQLNIATLQAAASACAAGSGTVLDLGSCVLGGLGAQLVAQQLQPHAASLVHACGLNATGCQLTPAGMQQLLQLMAPAVAAGSLRVLCLADNKSGVPGMSSLATLFPTPCPCLAVLDLSMNCLGNEGCRALSPILSHLPRLRCLGLGHNAIGSDGLRALAAGISGLQSLQELQLAGNVIGDEGIAALAPRLSALSSLEALCLQDNFNLGPECGRSLGGVLSACVSLRQLHLAKAHLGPEGARHLAAGVLAAPALVTLNLEHCKIRADGATALAGAASTAPTLQELLLARNSIGDAGACALAQALARSTTLTRLDLRHNAIGQVGAAALKQLLAKASCPLRSIAVAGNREDTDLGGWEQGTGAGAARQPAAAATAASAATAGGVVRGPGAPGMTRANSTGSAVMQRLNEQGVRGAGLDQEGGSISAGSSSAAVNRQQHLGAAARISKLNKAGSSTHTVTATAPAPFETGSHPATANAPPPSTPPNNPQQQQLTPGRLPGSSLIKQWRSSPRHMAQVLSPEASVSDDLGSSDYSSALVNQPSLGQQGSTTTGNIPPGNQTTPRRFITEGVSRLPSPGLTMMQGLAAAAAAAAAGSTAAAEAAAAIAAGGALGGDDAQGDSLAVAGKSGRGLAQELGSLTGSGGSGSRGKAGQLVLESEVEGSAGKRLAAGMGGGAAGKVGWGGLEWHGPDATPAPDEFEASSDSLEAALERYRKK